MYKEYGKCPKISNTFHTFLAKFAFYAVISKNT